MGGDIPACIMVQVMIHQKWKKMVLVFLSFSMALASAACGTAEQPVNTQAADRAVNSIETENSQTVMPENTGTEESKDVSTEIRETSQEAKKPKREYKQYETKYGKKHKVSSPEYVFSYPDGWKITTEDYDGNENMLTKEYVILSNKRGVEITFSRYDASNEGLGGYGEIMNEYQVKKVADSAFVPSYTKYAGDDDSQIEEFMVAEIKTTGELLMSVDEDFTAVDGAVCYGVFPKSYEGTHCATGPSGFLEEFMVEYGEYFSFIASAPDGTFTEKETEDVIEILSTFRPAE